MALTLRKRNLKRTFVTRISCFWYVYYNFGKTLSIELVHIRQEKCNWPATSLYVSN